MDAGFGLSRAKVVGQSIRIQEHLVHFEGVPLYNFHTSMGISEGL